MTFKFRAWWLACVARVEMRAAARHRAIWQLSRTSPPLNVVRFLDWWIDLFIRDLFLRLDSPRSNRFRALSISCETATPIVRRASCWSSRWLSRALSPPRVPARSRQVPAPTNGELLRRRRWGGAALVREAATRVLHGSAKPSSVTRNCVFPVAAAGHLGDPDPEQTFPGGSHRRSRSRPNGETFQFTFRELMLVRGVEGIDWQKISGEQLSHANYWRQAEMFSRFESFVVESINDRPVIHAPLKWYLFNVTVSSGTFKTIDAIRRRAGVEFARAVTWRPWAHFPLMTTSELLSSHRAIAEFTGVQHVPCRLKTSQCPNECNHARDVATFKIESYENYSNPSGKGDAEQRVFRARVDQKDPRESVTADLVTAIGKLAVGQRVRLAWEHVYVTETSTGSKWPERRLLSLETI